MSEVDTDDECAILLANSPDFGKLMRARCLLLCHLAQALIGVLDSGRTAHRTCLSQPFTHSMHSNIVNLAHGAIHARGLNVIVARACHLHRCTQTCLQLLLQALHNATCQHTNVHDCECKNMNT